MCEISVPHCAQQRSQLQSVYSIQRCRAAAHCKRSHCTDHVKRGAFSASNSGEEPGLCSPCQHERERAAHGKNDANIEEIIADVGFGFHANVK